MEGNKMANASILAAFQRMWQHVVNLVKERGVPSYTSSDYGKVLSPASSGLTWTTPKNVTRTVLYTNSNYTSAFSAQTVYISNLSNYDEICVEFRSEHEGNILLTSKTYIYDTSVYQWINETIAYGGNVINAYRFLKCQSNGIKFEGGYYNDLKNATWGVSDNTIFVPYRIIGYKYN
jgi:hypothetical protein